jgi:hypothetical protein
MKQAIIILSLCINIVLPLTCIKKNVAISGDDVFVTQPDGPTCETNSYCRTLKASSVNAHGVGGLFVCLFILLFYLQKPSPAS